MKEILDSIKGKIKEEVAKDNLNTGAITELAESYRRLSVFEADSVSEISNGLRTNRRNAIRVGEDYQPDGSEGITDEVMSLAKNFKGVFLPQEISVILELRRHFEGIKDDDTVKLIDTKIKQRLLELLGITEENIKGEKEE